MTVKVSPTKWEVKCSIHGYITVYGVPLDESDSHHLDCDFDMRLEALKVAREHRASHKGVA